MTSSLVGSEMCIRDRSLTRQLPQLQDDLKRDPSLFATLAETFESSVSYTHLTLPTICGV
eukprot:12444669-Prorocentrum_lima.AAC.1